MEFTTKDLRNTNNVLLRRVQRQVDVDNEIKDNEFDILSKSKKDKSFSKNIMNGFDEGFKEFEEEHCFKQVKKQSRLGLLKIRGGR
jgi:hypothetical protein